MCVEMWLVNQPLPLASSCFTDTVTFQSAVMLLSYSEDPLDRTLLYLFTPQVACGDTHTLVCTEGGALFTFGRNQNGQLGLGHTSDVLAPQWVTGLQVSGCPGGGGEPDRKRGKQV